MSSSLRPLVGERNETVNCKFRTFIQIEVRQRSQTFYVYEDKRKLSIDQSKELRTLKERKPDKVETAKTF